MESPPLAPPCALAEPCLVGEQNALGFGVWARRADLMRVLRPQISTPRLVVKPRPQKVCKALPPLCPVLPATLACDWTSLLVPTLTICRAVLRFAEIDSNLTPRIEGDVCFPQRAGGGLGGGGKGGA